MSYNVTVKDAVILVSRFVPDPASGRRDNERIMTLSITNTVTLIEQLHIALKEAREMDKDKQKIRIKLAQEAVETAEQKLIVAKTNLLMVMGTSKESKTKKSQATR